ncbi:hypothetical protein A2U01_0071559, partial [Trifolium medium]|nr:hypothetical protein [Trifolium medium]
MGQRVAATARERGEAPVSGKKTMNKCFWKGTD